MVKDSMNKTLLLLCLSFFLTACGSGGSDSGSFRLDITGVEKYVVHVSWSAQKEAQGYAIYVNNNRQSGTVSTTHTFVTGLKPGQRVCIYVRAIEPGFIFGVGPGSQSKTDCATTLANRPPPPPSGFTVTQPAEGNVIVNWDVPDDDGRIDKYLVYRDDVLVGTVFSPKYTDTDTVVGIRNCYQVQAVDNDGAISPRSESSCETEIDVTPPTVPGLPDVNAQAGNGHQVELVWTESVDRFGTTGYRVFRDQIQIADIALPGYFDDQTIVNTEYCYTIVAYDAAGNESASSEATCILAGWRRLLTEEGLGYTAGDIAVDIHGRVHIAFNTYRYISEDESFEENLRYVVLQADDSWSASVVSDTSAYQALPAITSDALGIQHLVYDSLYRNDVSGAWSSPVSMNSVGYTGLHDVVVDDQGFAHIIYRNSDNPSSLIYASNRSGQWEFEVIGQLTNYTYRNYMMEAAIALGINDRVHVAYYNDESKVLHHAMRDSGIWTAEPIIDNVDLVGRIDAAVDSNGSMHVVSYDATNSNLLYAVNDTGSWTVETVDSGDVGYESAIAIDMNGLVHVLYSDNTNLHVEGNYDSMLRYATRQNNSWTNQVLDVITSASKGYSTRDEVRYYETSPIGLQIDAVGYLHIMYEDNNHLVYSTNRPKL